jgi:small subunit ribosomal protein S20e
MDAKKGGKGAQDDQQPKVHYRLTISCKDVKAIEDITKNIIQRAKVRQEDQADLKVRGPRRMPTKVLKLTVRKSPCGNGTNTFDKYEMRIHKRVIDFNCTRTDLQNITKIEIGAGIIIEANELD